MNPLFCFVLFVLSFSGLRVDCPQDHSTRYFKRTVSQNKNKTKIGFRRSVPSPPPHSKTHLPRFPEKVVLPERDAKDLPQERPHHVGQAHRHQRQRQGLLRRESDLGNLVVVVALEVRRTPDAERVTTINNSGVDDRRGWVGGCVLLR